MQCGADGLVEPARDELAAAGLRPRRLRSHGDGHAHRAGAYRRRLAAAGARRGSEIAKDVARSTSSTVAQLLSAVYRKVGTRQSGLAVALLG